MKKLISTLSFILLVGVVAASAQCCNGKTANEKSHCEKTTCIKNQQSKEIKAYYFHGTHRCVTCQAVEAVTKEALREYYGDKIILQSLNFEEDANKSIVEKYQISGQTLLIVSSNKKVDLTNDAFMNARTNPDKLKEKIKSTIDQML